MHIWDKSKDLDISDDMAVISAINEAVKLRITLRDKWINSERLVSFVDKNRDGIVDYDGFYEGLSQFGITEKVNVDLVFAYMKHQNPESQSVPVRTMLETLNFNDDDNDDNGSNNDDVGEQQDKGSDKSEASGEKHNNKNKNSPAKGRGRFWSRFSTIHATTNLDGKEVKGIKEGRGGESNGFPKTLLVGIVAHSNLHSSMLNFVQGHIDFFRKVRLITTISTNSALSPLGLEADTLINASSAGTGTDQKDICSLIVKGEVAAVFFFTDPLSLHPHEADITALNRICCVHDTMFAGNPSSAECLVYALEHSAFGFSRLTGQHKSYQKSDSMIVEDYRQRINEGIWTRGSDDSSTVTSKLTSYTGLASTKNEDGSSDGAFWNEDEENTPPVGTESKLQDNNSVSESSEGPKKTQRFSNFSYYRRGRSAI